MNIVFWFLVFLAAAVVWWIFWPFFQKIGKATDDEIQAIKYEITNDYDEKENNNL